MDNVRNFVKYDENSDTCLVWINRNKKSRYKIGEKAGSNSWSRNHQDSTIKISGFKYQISHVVLFLHGIIVDSNFVVDHIDGNRFNNKISNLRVVEFKTNSQNRKIGTRNKTGVQGICFDTKNCRYIAYININRKQTLKYFKKFEDAVTWRKNMLLEAELTEQYTERHTEFNLKGI